MEKTTFFQDWELLQSPDATAPFSAGGGTAAASFFAGNPMVSDGIDDGSEDGAIKFDYFALDSDKSLLAGGPPSEVESEERDVDSDNPSWVDPDSDSRYSDRPRGRMAFAEMGFRPKVSDGFWSDESSDGQRSLLDSEKSELREIGESMTELGFEGIEAGHQFTERDASVVGGSEGAEAEQSELVSMRDDSDSLSRMSEVGDVSSDQPHAEGGERGMIWWKMPFELMKFCVLRVRPIWSLSIAAAFIGVVMLSRRLYKMKYKTRNIPLRIIFDDKKASQFMIRAARLNEAFSVVRRPPIIRPALQAGGGVTPWPAMSLR